MSAEAIEHQLAAALARHAWLTVAVSGGVDSMTLAALAQAHRPAGATRMVHALSPAVPAAATARVRARAARDGWRLEVVGAGEFEDPRYRANPVDRCYYCKTHLYDRIRERVPEGAIASGANLDDLGDYRPGLTAAAERGVIHPFIEAGIGKEHIRLLARRHGLDEVAERPAEPCLSSRVETGIAISADDLAFIEQAEASLAAALPANATLRCRMTARGVMVELGEAAHMPAVDIVRRLCGEAGRAFAGVRPYRRGSAFLGAPA
ncbi:adenine nucleotide alpha hydrolase [Ancylobacter sp. MQZ15Z-1]|uniref:Adenine nucleotide alpha hydrolase n=1 Tax=Ancylobacter mangrovi TaxID=2972472 RepID=A0A9X2T308_9HYPH|nr:adenine nucleotide alpha hydrolase [Ancylobacter mangrovi]MCS0494436.1 adenine nucleotide alpha hydrolase [Ancylobacter mangrovi]